MVMGFSMATEASLSEDDRMCMPPPKKVLRPGTKELEEAMRKGEIKLSIPSYQEELIFLPLTAADDSSKAKIVSSASHFSKKPVRSISGKCFVEFDNEERDSCFVSSCQFFPQQQECIFDEDKPNDSSVETDIVKKSVNDGNNNDLEDNGSTLNEHQKQKGLISTRFSDVIGHGAVKLRLDEVLLPLALPRDLADSVLTGIRSLSASILLFGPPGCGKTQLARAIAGEAQSAFISVGPSDILSKYVGESESAISSLFDKAFRKAQETESKTAVLFFDEIDALGQARGGGGSSSNSEVGGSSDGCSRRVLAELLIQLNRINKGEERNTSQSIDNDFDGNSEMGSVGSGYAGDDDDTTTSTTSSLEPFPSTEELAERRGRVIVVAATNRPDDCDQALLRRFAIRILVGLPSKRDRKRILKQYLSGIQHTLSKAQLDALAVATNGWSGSDLESLTREAAMAPVRECIRSAALLKRRAPQREQRSGDSSFQIGKGHREQDPHEAAKQKLLAQFRNLRPVSITDFENAIHFWMTNHRSAGSCSEKNVQRETLSCQDIHYDSSSGEED